MVTKHVLITGGNKGIGLATTKLFLKDGYVTTVVARDFSSFSEKDHPQIKTITYDLTNIDGIEKLVKVIGPIDILINNAGIMHSLPYDNYPAEKQEMIWRLNIEAPVALIREVSKGMIEKNGGRIVNLASIAGEIGHPDIWYGITKAGLINATKSFARLLGPQGIVVNAVAPSPVEDTNMFSVIPEARRESLLKSSILGRFTNPDEIARTVYWLATDSPEYINGICIDINNGIFPR